MPLVCIVSVGELSVLFPVNVVLYPLLKYVTVVVPLVHLRVRLPLLLSRAKT
uniref:Uncharacterized protein n=1 Tax=Arundo donax TaxID=35708 RepID=A0A0A9FB14_ARUDO